MKSYYEKFRNQNWYISTLRKTIKALEHFSKLGCDKTCEKLKIKAVIQNHLKPENQSHNLGRIKDQ